FMAAPDSMMPKWFRESRTALKETGKALIAYDEWGKNPARAAGGVTFNVLTTIFTGGAGTAAKGGAIAKTISVLGKVGRVVDPMTYVFKAGTFGVGKVGDLFTALKSLNSGASTDILSSAGHLQPDGTHLKFGDGVPVIKGDTLEWPGGARLNLKEGTVTLADGTKSAAHIELSAADRAALENTRPHHEPAMANTQPGEHAADRSAATRGTPRRAEHSPDGATNGFRNEASSEISKASGPSGSSDGAHIPEHAAHSDGQHPDHTVPSESSGAHSGSHSLSHTEHSGDQHQHTEGHSEGGPSHDVPSGDISPPPPGPGTKLLAQLDKTRAGVTNHLITEVDGRPVADYLDDLARDRAAAYRSAKEAGTFSRKQTGACVGAVIDLRTGQVFEGINGKADDIIPHDELHPTLAARYESIGDPPPHKDHPLGHAEVKAANELLKQRTKLGLPDGESALAELRASVEFPYLPNKETGLAGRSAPFCANCNHMLQGVPSSHGRFTGFPPSDENWIP
ncbi:hypothetical protein AB0451_19940, partial [Streptomyces sp. NPDC052000]